MAIHQEELQDIQGFKKEIEESAMGMILDNLQMYQYMYPQKSTVRELASNALDAIKEKQIALSILGGKSTVEEHFITRDDAVYKDSNFDPDYYDPKWLWTDRPAHNHWVNETLKEPDKVYITYCDGGDRDKDKILIEDFGVGLGGKRLEGYFKLGFSTKRNTKSALGKFGIGAKAALSTAPWYVMTTRYNGREYSFQIYSHNIVSIIPKTELETGKVNGVHMFSNGSMIYYRQTLLPNGTTIEVEAKKHHKQTYIDAVKSQMLYFDNVEFRIRNQHGGMDVIPTKAQIIYEDDYIILSDNNQYSKPHLLINKVNYGYVDFRELELEDLHGNIGIKVAAEDVRVNPSRESVIWDDVTRETVVSRFKTVVNIAEHMISEQLKVEDFIEWMKACCEISARYANSSSVVGRLSKIVDLSRVTPKYVKDQTIKFEYNLFRDIDARTVQLEEKREGSVIKYKIVRTETEVRDIANGFPFIVQNGRSSFKKDKYLLQAVYPTGFISIRLRYSKLEGIDEDATPEETEAPEDIRYMTTHEAVIAEKAKVKEEIFDLDKYRERATSIEHFIIESKHITPYASIVVPEDFDGKEEIEDEKPVEERKEEKISAEARRKLAGTIPIYTPRVVLSTNTIKSSTYNSNTQTRDHEYFDDNSVRLYEWQKIETPIADVDTWDDKEVFFATDKVISKHPDGKDMLESELLHLAACITRPKEDKLGHNYKHNSTRYGISAGDLDRCTHFSDLDSKKIKLIKVAQDRRKYFLDFKPIQRFFLDIKNKTLTMSNALIRWNTARVMYAHFEKLEFMENFVIFHPQHANTYRDLKQYVKDNYREVGDLARNNAFHGLRDSGYSDLVGHCDKVMKLQLFVREHKDQPDLIAKAVTELFNPEQEIIDGCAIEIVLYDKLMELTDYADPIHILLNELYVLTYVPKDGMQHKDISENLEREIREYLAFKGVVMQ